ncbi:hypothetical protein Sjap_017590 [Stephania japonica]|uniref:Large ribosomal subunit protein bL32m n=1 Tax=Stephania japonica TaxID=461633 RepID=A0AAP0I6J3_9MAGN
MAFRTTSKLKNIVGGLQCSLGNQRSNHIARLAPLEKTIDFQTETTYILPEFNNESDQKLEVPTFSFGGSMELMAVPKKKVSKHKKGIRNGPKALKTIPVIIRCRSCGRVKLPHFYCCSGIRGPNTESNNSTS